MSKRLSAKCLVFLLMALLPLLLSTPVLANVFASGLTPTGVNSFDFILNETASAGVTVQIWEVGGGMVHSDNLGALAKGAQSYAWDGSGYEAGKTYKAKIVASSSGHSGWTQISTDSTSTSFWSPLGVSAWTDQAHPNFGTIAVSNASSGTTSFGRPCTSGIYMLDPLGNDLGFKTGGVDWNAAGSSSPFKSTVGPDNHLYVVDYSRDLVFEFNEDLSFAQPLIDASNTTSAQYVASVHVEGTGDDRDIYLVNSNYYDTARKGLIKYHIGSSATVASGNIGQQYIGPGYFTYYPMDVARDSNGDWYMNQYRYYATEAPAITKFLDGTPPINTAAWETPKAAPYNGSYCLDIYEPLNWVAYGDYYLGMVFVFDMTTGAFVTSFDAGGRAREVAFDAAGNLITVDNSLEWMRIWSPAGANSFTTESWFEVTAIPEPSSLSALLMGIPVLLLRRRRR